MSNPVPSQPYPGPYSFDGSPLNGKLVDIPHGGTARLRREQPGMAEVIPELAVAAPQLGAAAADPYKTFVDCTDDLTAIRAARAVVDKLAEVLKESEIMYEHDRENAVGMILDAARSMAKRKGDPAILAAFDKTVAYAGQAAAKGQQTRKENAKEKAGSTTPSGSSTPNGGAHG